MKKRSLIIILVLALVFVTGCDNKKKVGVEKYAIQTHNYFNLRSYADKYYIENEEDLERFAAVFTDELNEYRDKLDGNTMFVQLIQKNSGSIQVELKDVNFDNNKVNFVVKTIDPKGAGTDDMALWYLVAIIPNTELEGLDLTDWANTTALIK